MIALVSARPERSAPWYVLRCTGNPELRAIPHLKDLGLETYSPMVREQRRVPRRSLSHAQRNSGVTLMRPRKVALFPGVVFFRGEPKGSRLVVKHGVHIRGVGPISAGDIEIINHGWDDIFALPSIAGFICCGDQPLRVPDESRTIKNEKGEPVNLPGIAELRAREINGMIAGSTPARMIFRIGEHLRVTDGPFTTFTGIIERVPDVAIQDIDADTRLRLLVDIFGRMTPVWLKAWQVEKL